MEAGVCLFELHALPELPCKRLRKMVTALLHEPPVACDMTLVASVLEHRRQRQLVDRAERACRKGPELLVAPRCCRRKHCIGCAHDRTQALRKRADIDDSTRGIAELARLGVAMGCNVHTFAGLAGIGDLIVTATSMHSRNNRAGILIGKGETPEQAVKEVGMVVEGMNALPAALELAAKYQVEMPIVQTVNAVVNQGMSAAEAVRSLMDRDPKNELPQSYEK